MFYLIEITTYNNGTNDSYGIYPYSDYDTAVANFHSKMGGAMKNANYQTEMLTVINDNGTTLRIEKFNRGENDGM